jgi:hypothetical protein
MDFVMRRQERGFPMSRYIATTLLAIAAAVVSVADFAALGEHADGALAALMVSP